MATTLVTEIKTTLAGECSRFECEGIHYARGEAVVLYRMPTELQLEDLLLPKGCLSVGYFWESRSYNAYHWVDDNRDTLALYFNICDQTRISEQQIAWRDLTLDVLITPDLRCRVLDEDELPDDLEPELLDYINETCGALCTDPTGLLRQFDHDSRKLLARY